MIAIILAAGYGNRMRPLTDRRHKTLLPVAGREILTRIVDGLVQNRIYRLVVVTGYRADDLETFLLSKYKDLSLTFVRNERYRETNNIYSMALAFEKTVIDQDILLIESDLIYDDRVIQRLIESKYPNVALVDRYRTGMDGTLITVENDVITSVIPSHQQGPKFDFSDKYKTLNIYKFSKGFCESTFKKLLIYYAKVIDSHCYYEMVLGMLIYMQRETIHAEVIDKESWAEVDDPNDLRAAEFLFNPGGRLHEIDRSFGGFWNYDFLDFGFIRNMYFPTPSMYSEMRNSLEALLQSYCSVHDILREKLAYLLLCEKEPLNVLGGACQAFPVLGEFLGDRPVLVPDPTFGEYGRVCRNLKKYPESGGDYLDRVEALLKGEDAVVFVNPNNPTGTTVAGEAIHAFAGRHRRNIVVVDESFVDFAGVHSVQELLDRAPLDNVIIIKSLSKCLGVPGARLGYTYSTCSEFNRAMNKLLPIWQIGSIAEFLLEVCLKHRRELADSYLATISDRNGFSSRLSAVAGIDKVFPSGGNFLMVKLDGGKDAAATVCERLIRQHGIYAKNVSKKISDADGYLRLAVRLPAENSRFADALAQCLGR
jgi:histidinol-phosphate/aromatic aminotransferase/cobyric acid decarboxylase-like protein/CTP:molybdopterin cytidylyltransferase MocA